MGINKIALKAGGPAGAGVFTIGAMIARTLQKMGLQVFYTADYPSLIKGGHNACYLRAEQEEVHSQLQIIDVLVAVDAQSIEKHYKELTENGAVIYDSDVRGIDKVDTSERKDIVMIPVPMTKTARELGDKIYRNVVAVGAVAALIQLDRKKLEMTLEKHFSGKKKDSNIIEANKSAVKKGHDYVKENFKDLDFKVKMEDKYKEESILLTGNDACSIGAIKAGCKFVSEYPMTPSSSILHFMASNEEKYKIVVKHAESEIAVINMLCGSAMTGARSMTATSGGGFALMSEGFGMAGLSETPFVVIQSQRTGPSTGIPTYTEQSDLRFMIHASQGEFPRLLCAPGDVDECFYETFKMFNLTDRVQTPGIILIDKHISASAKTTKPFDTSKLKIERGKLMTMEQMEKAKEKVLRYKITEDGISPRPVPGQPNGRYVSTSYEHWEDSFTTEDSQMRIAQVDKRDRKMLNIKEEEIAPVMIGPDNADLTIVSWGSNKGMIQQAMKFLKNEGINVNFMHVLWILPFPVKKVTEVLSKAKKVLIVEQNKYGQLRGLIRELTGILIENTLFKYDGRPIDPEEICHKVKEVM
ncbi:2-oxoacid:acceptor oxidoreductase subunit alpha [Candidatus Woesearchaeota archaeon]|nr:2-oxoacid:acceptor oxidoreductase subunit alpha [Candidatus Woesearchaeota archaeon]